MSGRTFADVDALEAVTADLLPTVPALRDATDAYRRALHALRAAPSDLEVGLDDHAPDLEDLADLLALLDELPAAFAFALRVLDHRSGAELAAIGCDVREAGDEALDRLAGLRLLHPTASVRELRALLMDPHATRPPTRGSAHAHWLVGTVDEIDLVASAGARVHAGLHPGARGASALRTLKHVSRVSGPVNAALPAYEQHLADRDDHNLTDGDRAIGMASATGLEGGGALAGFTAGAKLGALAGTFGGPFGIGVGTAAGGIGGAIVGVRGGRYARRTEPVRKAENRLARRRDRLRGTGHRDTYEQDHGVRSGR